MNPGELRYTEEHEWISIEGNVGTVGITEHAQSELGDVVFVELPEVGSTFQANNPFGSVESVKAVSEIYCPVSGEIIEVNPILADRPEVVNADPYGEAWMVKLRLSNSSETEKLMSAADYEAYTKGLQ